MHAGIVAEFVIQEAVTHIDGPDRPGSRLQKTVSKASCGGSHVQTSAARYRDSEMIQSPAELNASAGNIRNALGVVS